MTKTKKRIPLRREAQTAYVSSILVQVIDTYQDGIEEEFNKKFKNKKVPHVVASEILGEILKREGVKLLKKHSDVLRKYRHKIGR